MSQNNTYQAENFEGGGIGEPGPQIIGGSSSYPLSPVGPTGNDFFTKYTNVAKTTRQLDVVDATFKRFNTPPVLSFSGDSILINRKTENLESFNISEFFHPLLSFSEYQKQTFVINPRTTINIDNSGFESTNGEVSMIAARAYYLPEAEEEDRVIFWEYQGTQKYPMKDLVILTGAVKNEQTWNGWDVNPFSNYGNTGPAQISNGGLSFTNPTRFNVKLSIIISS